MRKVHYLKAKITRELLESLTHPIHDENGLEYINPIPKEPEGIRPRHKTLKERIQRIMRTELSDQADQQGFETFDESQDFDVDDDFEREVMSSKYEIMEDEQIPDSPEPAEPVEEETDQEQDVPVDETPTEEK